MLLKYYNAKKFNRGSSLFFEFVWYFFSSIFVESWLPGSSWRVWLLRLFGSKIGDGVVLKPYLKVKFPWRLQIGSYSWIGERVWIDNLADVVLGDNVCVSQGVYLCTGSHDWSSYTFNLQVKEILIKDYVWLCASSVVAPGSILNEGCVVLLGGVVSGRTEPWIVYGGNPINFVKKRHISDLGNLF